MIYIYIYISRNVDVLFGECFNFGLLVINFLESSFSIGFRQTLANSSSVVPPVYIRLTIENRESINSLWDARTSS